MPTSWPGATTTAAAPRTATTRSAKRILDGYRRARIPAQSVLMDWATFERYERFGTRTDRNNQPLRPDTRPLPELTDAERVVYERIGHPDWQRVRRIEQERIPLDEALAAVADRPAVSLPRRS